MMRVQSVLAFSSAEACISENSKNFVTQAFADLGPNSRAVTKLAWNVTLEAVNHPRSGRVIPNQDLIAGLARRIEAAYRLRCSLWCGSCSTARVWDRAAYYLWQAHDEAPDNSVPLDAELYVASQEISSRFANPWLDLARPEAMHRYRSRVKQIVRQLKVELTREIARAERAVRRGNAIHKVLKPGNRRLSPLGCYIAALRADRADLAERFSALAASQHQSCPLYQLASSALIPAEWYRFDLSPLAQVPRARNARAAALLPTLN